MNNWELKDKMFPDTDVVVTTMKEIPKEELGNYEMVSLYVSRLNRAAMVEKEEIIQMHSDGSMERYLLYSPYPPECIDSKPPLNIYFQYIWNELEQEKQNEN